MLNNAIDSYLAVRRAGGFKLKGDEHYLHSFARFALDQGDTHVVARTAIAWAEQARSEPQRANRLNVVIRFARFNRVIDNRHEIPPSNVFCAHRRRPTPYLYTEKEVQALMNHAAQLGPLGSLRPHTYSTLIGLLAATGLRISEALGLHLKDLTADGLVIRETKFRKNRLITLHETTRVALEQYQIKRAHVAAFDDHLFVTCRHRALDQDVVYKTFHQLLNAAGLPRQSGQPRPRLIDFRHTFASNALLACPHDRDAVGCHMLALMTYLGHAHPSSTYWYLESSPQLVGDIAQACEQWVEENTL